MCQNGRFLGIIIFMLLLMHSYTLTIILESGQEQCYYQPMTNAHYKMQFQFQVLKGGFLDIDVFIKSPLGDEIYTARQKTEDKQEFMAYQEGNYQICLSNKMSTYSSKTVMFDLHVGDWLDWNLSKKAQSDTMQERVERLEHALRLILFEQKYYQTREKSHRDLVEETNTKVVIWGIVEIAVLIIASLFQVFYLRHFFNVRLV